MRKIIHIDMDCFYAAVEVKHRPDLKGKPIGVGGPADSRSVLCTANYEARKFGVRAAMPSSRAVKLCPQLILIPPHFELYKQENRRVRAIVDRFTSLVEPLSLDEAYLDVSNCTQFQGSASLIAQEIKRLILLETGLTASAGVAPNKFLAKVASDWKKPNGLFVIRPQDVESFMPPLPVEKIFGVGKVTAERLHAVGIRTCGDLQALSENRLQEIFGSKADYYRRVAHGIDDREVCTHWERKSLSVEETYRNDLTSLNQVLKEVPSLYEQWVHRMEKGGAKEKIKGLVVKVKTSEFQSSTLEEAQKDFPERKDFERLFCKIWERYSSPLRLLGLGARLAVPPEPSVSRKSSGASLSQLSFF